MARPKAGLPSEQSGKLPRAPDMQVPLMAQVYSISYEAT